jgi:hypothetical protein
VGTVGGQIGSVRSDQTTSGTIDFDLEGIAVVLALDGMIHVFRYVNLASAVVSLNRQEPLRRIIVTRPLS